MHTYTDETREAVAPAAAVWRRGANTAANHKTVMDRALTQIPAEYIGSIDIPVRADSVGVTHELADDCYEAKMRFSFGYDRTEPIRTAILEVRHARAPDWSGGDSQRAHGAPNSIS